MKNYVAKQIVQWHSLCKQNNNLNQNNKKRIPYIVTEFFTPYNYFTKQKTLSISFNLSKHIEIAFLFVYKIS